MLKKFLYELEQKNIDQYNEKVYLQTILFYNMYIVLYKWCLYILFFFFDASIILILIAEIKAWLILQHIFMSCYISKVV